MGLPLDQRDGLSRESEKRLLWLTVVFAAVLLLVLAAVSVVIWPRNPEGKPIWDSAKNTIIMFIPVPILEWSFAGAMVSVLFRLAYRKRISRVGLELYTWAIAKPVIGLFTGALVYFLALAGAKLFDGSLRDVLWLNVVAFVGGFSDDLSIGLIKRFVRRRLGGDRSIDEEDS